MYSIYIITLIYLFFKASVYIYKIIVLGLAFTWRAVFEKYRQCIFGDAAYPAMIECEHVDDGAGVAVRAGVK